VGAASQFRLGQVEAFPVLPKLFAEGARDHGEGESIVVCYSRHGLL
jgi:hypothetical protein